MIPTSLHDAVTGATEPVEPLFARAVIDAHRVLTATRAAARGDGAPFMSPLEATKCLRGTSYTLSGEHGTDRGDTSHHVLGVSSSIGSFIESMPEAWGQLPAQVRETLKDSIMGAHPDIMFGTRPVATLTDTGPQWNGYTSFNVPSAGIVGEFVYLGGYALYNRLKGDPATLGHVIQLAINARILEKVTGCEYHTGRVAYLPKDLPSDWAAEGMGLDGYAKEDPSTWLTGISVDLTAKAVVDAADIAIRSAEKAWGIVQDGGMAPRWRVGLPVGARIDPRGNEPTVSMPVPETQSHPDGHTPLMTSKCWECKYCVHRERCSEDLDQEEAINPERKL